MGKTPQKGRGNTDAGIIKKREGGGKKKSYRTDKKALRPTKLPR